LDDEESSDEEPGDEEPEDGLQTAEDRARGAEEADDKQRQEARMAISTET